MDDYDDTLWDTDFDSDGDIDADDDIVGDLIFIEFLRNYNENARVHLSQHQTTGALSPWAIAVSVLVFLFLMMIICSTSA